MKIKLKEFRKINRKNNPDYFRCSECNSTFIEKHFYRTKKDDDIVDFNDLVYLCEKCYKKLKEQKKDLTKLADFFIRYE